MNLEKMNVFEMNTQETRVINGGCPHCILVSVGKAVLGFLAGVGDGIRDGLND